jgi:hypothetical protein
MAEHNAVRIIQIKNTKEALHGTSHVFFSYRLPGLESSSGNRKEEDSMYDEMMLSLLKIVTKPLISCLDARVAEVAPTVVDKTSTGGLQSDFLKHPHGYWNQVQGPFPVTFGSDKLWKNLMSWRLFTRKNRSKILVK